MTKISVSILLITQLCELITSLLINSSMLKFHLLFIFWTRCLDNVVVREASRVCLQPATTATTSPPAAPGGPTPRCRMNHIYNLHMSGMEGGEVFRMGPNHRCLQHHVDFNSPLQDYPNSDSNQAIVAFIYGLFLFKKCRDDLEKIDFFSFY